MSRDHGLPATWILRSKFDSDKSESNLSLAKTGSRAEKRGESTAAARTAAAAVAEVEGLGPRHRAGSRERSSPLKYAAGLACLATQLVFNLGTRPLSNPVQILLRYPPGNNGTTGYCIKPQAPFNSSETAVPPSLPQSNKLVTHRGRDLSLNYTNKCPVKRRCVENCAR
ncbi:hypothetical protein J6590_002458 [Homalodisca vitripennis]|nr:hypothetical protein J6590_002458 [Homalodisca vitripennis]